MEKKWDEHAYRLVNNPAVPIIKFQSKVNKSYRTVYVIRILSIASFAFDFRSCMPFGRLCILT